MTIRKNLLFYSSLLATALISHAAFAQSMVGAPGSASSAPPTSPGIIWNQPGQTSAPPASAPPANVKRAPAAMKLAPAPMAQNPDQRNIDDRKLNSLAAEFMNINPKGQDASTKLAKLSKNVDAFHKALFTRGYNAMDILKDTENLQNRIAAAKTKAAAEANPPPAPTPESAPAPMASPAPQPSGAPHDVPPPEPAGQ